MVVARRSGSGTLPDLRKRDSPLKLANGWIRGNVVKVIGIPLTGYNHVIVVKTP